MRHLRLHVRPRGQDADDREDTIAAPEAFKDLKLNGKPLTVGACGCGGDPSAAVAVARLAIEEERICPLEPLSEAI